MVWWHLLLTFSYRRFLATTDDIHLCPSWLSSLAIAVILECPAAKLLCRAHRWTESFSFLAAKGNAL